MSLSLRIEGLVRPMGSWQPISHPETEEEQYGILLYPEATFSPSRSVSILLRSLVSPVDASASFVTGFDWNVYQGFHLLAFCILQAGEAEDLFSWEKPGGFSTMIGFRHIF